MQTYNEACNAISKIAFKKKVFNKFALSYEAYHEVRNVYKLSSALTCMAIKKVAAAYRRNKKRKCSFNIGGSILYTERSIRYKNNSVSIQVIGGRTEMTIACYNKNLLSKAQGGAELVIQKGKYYLYQTIEVECEAQTIPNTFIGIDMGITDIVALSDGTLFSSKEIKNRRNKYRKTRASIQAKGTRSSKKLLKRLSNKESRYATLVNHTISKQIVSRAKKERKGIAIEDLRYIRRRVDKTTKSKEMRRNINNFWSFAQLRSFLEYKCKEHGVRLEIINPAYTSQTCNNCMHIGERQGKSFYCKHCGNNADADINAALNIAAWGYANTHERWDLLSCSLQDNLFTSKVKPQ